MQDKKKIKNISLFIQILIKNINQTYDDNKLFEFNKMVD